MHPGYRQRENNRSILEKDSGISLWLTGIFLAESLDEMSQARQNDQVIGQKNFGFRKSYIADRFRSVEKRFRKEVLSFFVDYFCLKNDVGLKEFLENFERNIIIRALSRFNGNQRHTAKYLGLKHTTLHHKVKRYNIHFRKQPTTEEIWSETAD